MKPIVVTGTPGTGKTSFAQKLAQTRELEYIDINDLLLREGSTEEYDEDRETYVVNLEKGRRALAENLSPQQVVESHIAHLVVPPDMLSVCFVLRCSPYVLRERLRGKGFSEEKVKENVAAEILGIVTSESVDAYGEELVYELVTSDGMEEVVNEATTALDGGNTSQVGSVDWLSEVTSKGDLQSFLG